MFYILIFPFDIHHLVAIIPCIIMNWLIHEVYLVVKKLAIKRCLKRISNLIEENISKTNYTNGNNIFYEKYFHKINVRKNH
jgi:hypothetical protein